MAEYQASDRGIWEADPSLPDPSRLGIGACGIAAISNHPGPKGAERGAEGEKGN